MDVIQQIGAVVGIFSFIGLGILSFLYFAQARHVRDLEEKATYLPDDLDLPTSVTEADSEDEREAVTAQAPAAAQAGGQPQLQAARQVEMARAAAERRARFEQRRRGPLGGVPRPAGATGGRRMPEPRQMALIGAGVAVLAVGLVFAASRIVGGDETSSSSSSGPTATTAEGTLAEDIQVAVLNGTPTPGLAAQFGQEVRSNFKLGAVTNTETPFEASVVMFDMGQEAAAQTVAKHFQVQTEPMTSDVKKASEGAPVAFVVGEDRAGQQ